ncbi:MAG TPA: hypothetical protein VMR41_02975, partial [Patescibacteria group bacterium]|nr:hypothetical protein [Patescibacteria group bacterium]
GGIITNTGSIGNDETGVQALADVLLTTNYGVDQFIIVTAQGSAVTANGSLHNMYGYIIR